MIMTVREWFRGMRRVPWDDQTLHDVERLTEKVVRGEPIDLIEDLHPYKIIFGELEAWERQEVLVEKVRQQLNQAVWELEREASRRAALTRYAKDILT